MKKDGIQTRNRKLSAKSKKKRGSVIDFFSPFDPSGSSKHFSAAYGSASANYLASPMSQYYGSQFSGMYSSAAAAGVHGAAGGHSFQSGTSSFGGLGPSAATVAAVAALGQNPQSMAMT